jgi:hypothetical protein
MMMKFQRTFSVRICRPADGEGGDLGGDTHIPEGADRGDNFVPTDDKPEVKPSNTPPEVKATTEAKPDAKDTPPKPDEKPGDKPAEGDKKKGVIPLDRHEAVLARERQQREALEAQLRQFQGGKKVAETNEGIAKLETKLSGLDAEYAKAVADGDTKKAATLMQDIRRLDREISETRTEFRIEAARTQAVELARYETVVERIEEAYPQLDPESDQYDKALDQDVADLMETYQRRGLPPAKALQQAVERLVKPSTTQQEAATTVTPRVSDEDTAAAAEKLSKERKEGAVKATTDAARRTPPNTDKVGQNSDKMGGGLNPRDVINLPYDEFVKLDEKELAKLRGDEL